jgi:signal transduction histidine kinase
MHSWRLPARTMTAAAQSSHPTHTRLAGRRLHLARAVWLILMLFLLGVSIASQPTGFARLHLPCRADAVTCNGNGLLTASQIKALPSLGLSLDTYTWFWIVINGLLALLSFVMGTILFWRRSDDWMVLLVALLFGGVGAANATAVLEFSAFPWDALWNSVLLIQGLAILLTLALFPTGRFVPRFTLWVVLVNPLYVVFYLGVLNQLHLPGWTLSNNPVNAVAWFGCWAILTLAQLYRYFRVSTPVEQQQTKWVALTFLLFLVVGFARFAFAPALLSLQHSAFLYLLIVDSSPIIKFLLPLSIGIAILRYRLYEIDRIANRALVYGTLSSCVVGLYVGVVGYLGALFRTGGNLLISLFAAGLVAVLFQPLREVLQRGVNRLFYGQRDEPYKVVSRLGQRLEATLAAEAVLPTIVETVAQALKLPYAAMNVQQDGRVILAASTGKAQDELLRLPLSYQGEPIGELMLAPRGSGESFTSADRVLLVDLARQAGVAAHALRLTADLQLLTAQLQRSRTQLVTTREEERRRLRRDLHDGLGSALTSVTFQLDAASNLLDRDPQAVKTLLGELKAQMQGSIADIRRLVYDLRPPILDEWGLVAAVREQVAQYQLHQLRVSVEAPEVLPPLSAALEVAAYRIALEALANVVRHAQATTCTICFALEGEALLIDVCDNGKGLPRDHHAGVGIAAMRERAMELGGTFQVEQQAGSSGTRVVTSLPLAKE